LDEMKLAEKLCGTCKEIQRKLTKSYLKAS
jgi:hypothetical protein